MGFNNDLQLVKKLIEQGELAEAIQKCDSIVQEREYTDLEIIDFVHIKIQCYFMGIAFDDFFAGEESSVVNTSTIYNSEYDDVMEMFFEDFKTIPFLVDASDRDRYLEIVGNALSKVYEIANQKLFDEAETYFGYAVEKRDTAIVVRFTSGHYCLVSNITECMKKLKFPVDPKGIKLATYLDECERRMNKFYYEAACKIDQIIRDNSEDFPYYYCVIGAEDNTADLYHIGEFFFGAIKDMEEKSIIERVGILKKRVDFRCNYLNAISVASNESNVAKVSVCVGQERRNKIYSKILNDQRVICEFEPNYKLPDVNVIAYKEPSKGGCYVATAVYGSYDCPEVWTLRRYRDFKLAKTWHGRTFIRIYYAVSPTLVKLFGHTKWFKELWRVKLDRMVSELQAEGFESTPYND